MNVNKYPHRKEKIMDISNVVTKIRFKYHANMLSVNNALNQMHFISDEKAEMKNKHHTMLIFNDILPRMGYDFREEGEA